MANNESSSGEERINELIALYLHAIEIGEPLDLEKFLAENPEYAQEIQSFIRNHEQLQRIAEANKEQQRPPYSLDAFDETLFAESPAGVDPKPSSKIDSSRPNSRTPATAGTMIAGRYILVSKIGEGGMGEVWAAKQIEPVKRKVAIKLIRLGMDSKSVSQRFEQERQALAMMDHPNIAKVLDGGISDDGRPFFALELVNGLPLSKYCDEARLSIRERLELFVPICQAVQHAHQKGIVHRDLKPSNILVTLIDGRPIPKIIDFGVAKALGGKLTEHTMSTQFGAILGTVEYMPPEQVGFSGTHVDTRADIYSLGVILYEILTGLKPFDSQRLRVAAFGELLRIIREEEPSKPSTRISTDDGLPSLAALRRIEPARLPKLLRGDLDWVVMKCMEKQRDRRYETANALARDIQRYLTDEAVEARPPSTAYQIQKLVRRHKGLFITSALIFLSMFFGVIGTTLGQLEAMRQQSLAIGEKNIAIELAASEAQAREEVEQQRKLADDRAETLQATLAESYFRQGLYEYEAGQPNSALIDLTRALAMTKPDSPLASSYRRVLVDRCIRGGRLQIPPLWHDGPVYSSSFSKDGTRIVTASGDKTVRIWDATTGIPIGKPMVHAKEVADAIFSPDGTRIVTRSHNEARLWDAFSRAPIGATMQHDDVITSFAFSPDGAHVVTGSVDKTARLWDAQTGLPFASVMKHDAPIYCVAFSPNGKRIATGTGDHTKTGLVHLWDAQSGTQVGDGIPDFKNIVHSVTFSHDSTRLLTGGQDWTARVWDAETGTFLGPKIQSDTPIGNAIFSPDGSRILTCVSDLGGYESFTARLWDAKTGLPIGAVMDHSGHVQSMAFSPDGTFVVTASKAKRGYAAWLWDANTGVRVGEPMHHQSNITSVSFSPDGSRVLTGSYDRASRLWNIHAENLVVEEMKYPKEDRPVVVAYNRDGTRFITGGGGKGLRYRTGFTHLYESRTGVPIVKEMNHPYHVHCAAFSPDGTRIVIGSGEWAIAGQAQLWDANTGTLIADAMNHSQYVRCAAFSPDGNYIVTTSSDGTARLWDAHNGVNIGKEMKHRGGVIQAAFSPDGSRIVTASMDLTARLWDAHTGEPLGKELNHESDVQAVAFHPDGTIIATGSYGGVAQLWDAESGERRGNLMKHDDVINSVGFSQDGTRLVTGSRDFTVRLWDAHSGAPLGEVMRHDDQVKGVSFSPDGTLIGTTASSWWSGNVRLWEAHTGASMGTVMNHVRASSVAFSPDGDNVVSGGYATARLWNVTIPECEPNSATLFRQILQLWTGFDAEEDGTPHPLSSMELYEKHQQVGHNDPLRQFVMKRWQSGTRIYHAQAASAAEDEGRWSTAMHHLEMIMKSSHGNPTTQARYTFARAKVAEARGDLDQALKEFDEAIRIDSSNSTFYFHRGDFRLRQRNDRDAALADYNLAIQHLTIGTIRLNEKAWIWGTSRQEHQRNGICAVIAATKACELTEWKSSMMIDTLAAAYAEGNDFENAVKWQARAIEICPEQYRNEFVSRLELYKSNKPHRD